MKNLELSFLRNHHWFRTIDRVIDILYVVYGTILEHGLQDKIEAIFEEVHRSNMSKDYDEYKMVKGPSYFKANVKKFFKEEFADK